MSEARKLIEGFLGDQLTVEENAELYVLMQGGACIRDVGTALIDWQEARKLDDDWAFITRRILHYAAVQAVRNHPRLTDENGHG